MLPRGGGLTPTHLLAPKMTLEPCPPTSPSRLDILQSFPPSSKENLSCVKHFEASGNSLLGSQASSPTQPGFVGCGARLRGPRGPGGACQAVQARSPPPSPVRGPGQSAGQCGNGCRVMRLPRAGMESCTTSQLILLAQHALCVPHRRWPTTSRGKRAAPSPPRGGHSWRPPGSFPACCRPALKNHTLFCFQGDEQPEY